jgi:DDE superfamily endonuclease
LQEYFELATRPQNGGYQFLILDGHGSYLILEFQNFCFQNKIILLYLLPHILHLLQPLDITIFSPLKHYFRCAVEKRLQTGVLRFLKTEFLETYKKIHSQVLTAKNIKAGFQKAGLVPFDPQKALE